MNKKVFRYNCCTFLFIIILSGISTISYAGDVVKKINLAELNALLEGNRGKVVVLNLWATWCPPCRKEIPGFLNLYGKYKDKGLEILGVAFDENGEEVVPPFLKALGVNYSNYLDGGDIAPAYDLQAYPTTILYGRDGKVISRHIGYLSEKDLDKELSKLFKK